MKFSAIFALVVAVLALLFSAGQAGSPLPDLKVSIKKIVSVVKTGISKIGISKIGGVASTAHNAWENFNDRNQE